MSQICLKTHNFDTKLTKKDLKKTILKLEKIFLIKEKKKKTESNL